MSEDSCHEDEEDLLDDEGTDQQLEDFDETTRRLIAEFVHKTNVTPEKLMNSESFQNLMHHLNPTTTKLTEHDIISYTTRYKYPYDEIRCIVCGKFGEDKEQSVLSVEDASMVLATLMAGTQIKEREAEMIIASGSLRACSYHLSFICSAMMAFLKIDDSFDLSLTPMHKLAEACMWYKEMMTCRYGKREGNVLIPQFKVAITTFLNTHYDADALNNQGTSESPSLRTPPSISFVSPDNSPQKPETSGRVKRFVLRPTSNSTSSTKTPMRRPQIITLANGKKVIRVSSLPSKMNGIAANPQMVKYRIAKRPTPPTDNVGTSAAESSNSKIPRFEEPIGE